MKGYASLSREDGDEPQELLSMESVHLDVLSDFSLDLEGFVCDQDGSTYHKCVLYFVPDRSGMKMNRRDFQHKTGCFSLDFRHLSTAGNQGENGSGFHLAPSVRFVRTGSGSPLALPASRAETRVDPWRIGDESCNEN